MTTSPAATETPLIGQSALAEFDIVVAMGADNAFVCQWLQPDGVTSVDVTGYTGLGQIRNRVGGDILGTFTITCGTQGSVTIFLPHAQSSLAGFDKYAQTGGVFDVELTSAGGLITRFAEGKVEISRDVTRA